MTTGMDRLTAALQGKPCDRIPVFCNLIDQGARELGLSIEDYFADGAHVAEAQVRMRAKYGHDNVWSLFYVGKEAELLGCKEVLYATDGPPNVADFVIREPADVETLEVPADLESHPAFAEQKKCLQLLEDEVGGRYPICAYITSTMSLPIMLMGMEKWLEMLLIGPAEVCDLLLEKCFDFFVKEMTAFRHAGADVLVYSNPFGSTDTIPLKYFVETCLPWIQREIAAVGDAGMVYYCGMSRFNRVIDTVMDQTPLRIFYISPLDDLGEAKQIIGDRGLTCGVVNDIQLLEWSPEKVRREVKRLIEVGRPGGHFLFGTGVMPYNIPEVNIRAMLAAAFEYGRYDRGGQGG